MRKVIPLVAISLFFTSQIISQTINEDFERIKIDSDAKHLYTGIDLSPDAKYVAVSGNKEYPLYIYDWENRKIIKTYNVGDWWAGSAVRYSKNGRYILIQQLKLIDWAPNKDKEVTFDVIDAENGNIIKRLDPFHAVCFTPDEKYAISLTANEVAFWNLDNGTKEKSFIVENASNGLAISPDGSMIAVSHHASDKELAKQPRYKKDKKARKFAVKYKHQVSVYNVSDFSKKFTVDELYDIIYKLDYSDDGNTLFCMQIPHGKIQTGNNERLTYVTTINALTGEAYRKGYTSNAIYEPDFKLSHDGKLFGIVSQGSKFLEIHVYDAETAKMLHRFKLSYRIMEKSDGDYLIGDSRTSFVFLPDNERILMTNGNRLILWNIK